MRLEAATLAAAVLAAACAPTVPNITVTSPGKIAPLPDAVIVVVVQPATHLRSVSILDGWGQLVGQLQDRSHTVIRLKEGPTLLYAVLGKDPATADRIEGTLVPGRVYYATVGPREGGVALRALNPRSPEGRWSHKNEYLATTPRLQMDPERVTRAANELGDTEAILKAGDAYVATLDADAYAERAIQETDGF
jgi:hypothetical protein